jgi:hypothetical protein
MPKRSKEEADTWYRPPEVEICPLCEREIPASQRDEHHLIPKMKGGRVTQYMHRICHRQIHALFSERELAQTYNSVDALLEHEEIRKFVQWVKTKPDGFIERTKRSNRRR